MNADKLEMTRQQNMEHFGFGPSAMKQIKVCPQCRRPSPTDTHFCVVCGHRLPKDTLYDLYREQHRMCLSCDTVLTEEMAFCPHCGMKIKDNI